jgi:hypothetical protein
LIAMGLGITKIIFKKFYAAGTVVNNKLYRQKTIEAPK